MGETTASQNNRAIAFRGRVQRERPRIEAVSASVDAQQAHEDDTDAVGRLKRRGLISDRAEAKMRARRLPERSGGNQAGG